MWRKTAPCTQEIAVPRLRRDRGTADGQVVVIDTAPTATRYLLNLRRATTAKFNAPLGRFLNRAAQLLPRLKSDETKCLLYTAGGDAPLRAIRLEDDLKRAGIPSGGSPINRSMANTANPCGAAGEVEWLNRINEHADGKFALIAWNAGRSRAKDCWRCKEVKMTRSRYLRTHNFAAVRSRRRWPPSCGDVFESYSAGTETKPQINKTLCG